MLGEQIGESKGKRTLRRVVSADGGVAIEVSFEAGGKVLGLDMNEVGSYTSRLRSDGTVFGEGQGIVMAADGQSASWKGSGIGRMLAGGAVSFRGAIYFSSNSPGLARLNVMTVVFEHEVDPSGSTTSKLWEWR